MEAERKNFTTVLQFEHQFAHVHVQCIYIVHACTCSVGPKGNNAFACSSTCSQ